MTLTRGARAYHDFPIPPPCLRVPSLASVAALAGETGLDRGLVLWLIAPVTAELAALIDARSIPL